MGFLDSIFGGGESSVSFKKVPQSKEAIKARRELFGLAFGEPPDVPRQQIAPLPPITEERTLARETAKELAQPQDIFSLPEVQAIIFETKQAGDLLANRLGRALQASGNITSTTGRDVLGRAVTDVQKSLTSSLAPFAAEERRRRTSLIPVLESLGLTQEERERGFSQAELNALFQQEFAESQQLQSFTIPLLRSVIQDQPAQQPVVTPGSPSLFQQAAPIIGAGLTGALTGGFGGFGFGGVPKGFENL